MAGITELANNIADTVTGVVDLIAQQDTLPKYPKGDKNVDRIVSSIDQGNWLKLSFPYTFSVEGQGTTDKDFTDFSLPLPPNAIDFSEPPAINITRTQGGTTVEHNGMRYGKLSIKGTTGLAPFKGAGGAVARTGKAILAPNDLKHRSGYEVFLHFRNWLRAYYEFKRSNPTKAKDYRLVFKNYKDGEFLIVELTDFRTSRQAARSLLYDYALEFEVIARFTYEDPDKKFTIDDFLAAAVEAIDTSRGIILQSQDLLRQVEATYNSVVVDPLRKVALTLKAAQNTPTVAADISTRTIRNTVSAGATLGILLGIQEQQKENDITGDLDPRIASIPLPKDLEAAASNNNVDIFSTFGNGMMALDPSIFPKDTLAAHQEEKSKVLTLPRQFYTDTAKELHRVRKNLEDFLNLGDDGYDTLFDRTKTLSNADLAKIPTLEEYGLLKAFSDAIDGIHQLLSTEDLFKSTFDARVADMVTRFGGGIPLQGSQAARQIQVPSNTTLEMLALRELGDSNRWGEIAELNNLRSPYLVSDTDNQPANTLAAGDYILIPAPLIDGFSQAPAVPDIPTTINLNEVEKSLGTDLKLSPTFDLVLSATGDFEVISGTDNLVQQILLKLGYEKGDLIQSPEIGVGVVPGSKFPPLTEIRDGVTNSLLRDPRIESLSELSLERENSALYLTMTIQIKNVDLPIPLKIKVA